VAEYEDKVRKSSELSRRIDEQKRILEDLDMEIEKKSGLFA